jgi:hypothetical protein
MKRAQLKPSKILPRRVPIERNAPMKSTRKASTPARRAAKGQPCTMNVAGVCNYDVATSVLAHFRWLGDCGTGCKPNDTQAAHACSECNRWTDSPTPAETRDRKQYESDRNFYAARALARMRALDQSEAE